MRCSEADVPDMPDCMIWRVLWWMLIARDQQRESLVEVAAEAAAGLRGVSGMVAAFWYVRVGEMSIRVVMIILVL